MNWGLVQWFGGVLITVGLMKFLLILFKRIFSRDTADTVIKAAGEGCSNAADAGARYVKRKMIMAKTKRDIERAKKSNKPIVYIR